MTDEEWEEWEEWLVQPRTKALLRSLQHRSKALETDYKDSLFQSPADPSTGRYPDLRARSQVLAELSQLDRETLTELLDYDPEHDRN